MSKKEQVTYQVVARVANELKGQAITPTVRAIRERIGFGSNSTVLEYLRRWEADEVMAATVTEGLSDGFKQAINAEFGRLMQATREKLEAQLAKEKQHTKEANELLAEAENKISDLEARLELEKTQAAEAILRLEKQLAAANELNAELQRQNEKLELQWKESITAQEAARTEAAKAQMQVERADKAAEKAEKQLTDVQKEFTQLQQVLQQSKINEAVAKTRVEELEKQVKRSQ